MSDHTPGPWTIETYTGVLGATVTADKGRSQVADCADRDNAAFIVRACNAHEELLAVARGCLGYFEYLSHQEGGKFAPDESWLAPLRAAIAQAEKRS